MKTSTIALTLLLSQYIVDGQLVNAPIKRTRVLSSTTDNAISSSKQQQRINTARLLKTKRRRDNNKAQRLLEDDGSSMSLATTDSMSMSVSLEPDVKDMFAATADSDPAGEKGVAESSGVFGSFEGVIMPSTVDAKAEKHSKATKLFKESRSLRESTIKRRVSPADRFSSVRNLQEVEGSMSLATETSMSFLIEPEVKDMFVAAGGDIEATTVDFVKPLNKMFSKSSKAKAFKSKTVKAGKEVSAKGAFGKAEKVAAKVFKTKSSKAISSEKVADAKAEKVASAKAEKVAGAKAEKVARRHRL